MTVNKAARLSKIAKEFNVGISTIVEFLDTKGVSIDSNPNTKISPENYTMVQKEFSSDLSLKKESEKVNLKTLRDNKKSVSINDLNEEETNQQESSEEDELLIHDGGISNKVFESESKKDIEKSIKVNVVGKIDLDKEKETEKAEEKEEPKDIPEPKVVPEEKPEVKEEIKEAVKEEAPAKAEEVEKPVAEEKPAAVEKKAEEEESKENVKVVGKIDLDSINQKTRPDKKKKVQEKKEAPVAPKKEVKSKKPEKEEVVKEKPVVQEKKEEPKEQPKAETPTEPKAKEDDVIRAKVKKLSGPTVIGKMELPVKEKKVPEKKESNFDKKKKRKRIRKETERVNPDSTQSKPTGKPRFEPKKLGTKPSGQGGGSHPGNRGNSRNQKRRKPQVEISQEDIQKQVKDTLARLTSKGKSKGSKYRREKRDNVSQRKQDEMDMQEAEKSVLKVTEFVSVGELASLMEVQVNEIIATCMNLGLIVSINQRLDAETMSIVTEEFGYTVEFISADSQDTIEEVEDDPKDLIDRPPIVTVMGHVDHGKTKLLDYIRSANVVAGEAGGITQHIGAYRVELEDGRKITFLDTPGHEAFTAMRARGAQLTDVTIIVVAADDGVMPQTEEAINHAQAASVPMVFAINKIDKNAANPDRVKEELSQRNVLVEDWGGKFQSQEVSAKSGLNIEDLLEKVLLEAELLELKANPNKPAVGAIIESSLDKGRGYVATVLVQSGTLKIGDIMLAGEHYGRVKAMYNERGKAVKEAGPSSPVLVLGLDGAPQAGDKFNIFEQERDAREIATKRSQLQREQGLRTHKHITLDEIGRRIAIGNFQELNVIVKGDVDGSVEALSDSLMKLSTEEIQVNIISKAVGQISEADVYLASASDAIILGFQVRPSLSARRLAEREEIDIRLYSIIYDAIEEVKAAMEGMLSPEIKETIVANLEILETFKITKVGTIAGCMVREGKIKRDHKVRVIRDGIVIYDGLLGSLKRFKDEAKEVVVGLECGLNIENFNDIKVGDIVEAYEQFEVKKKL